MWRMAVLLGDLLPGLGDGGATVAARQGGDGQGSDSRASCAPMRDPVLFIVLLERQAGSSSELKRAIPVLGRSAVQSVRWMMGTSAAHLDQLFTFYRAGCRKGSGVAMQSLSPWAVVGSGRTMAAGGPMCVACGHVQSCGGHGVAMWHMHAKAAGRALAWS